MTTSAPRWGLLALACCVLLSSCIQTPPAVPLDPDAVLADVRAEREDAPTPEGQPLTLAQASALLRRANPKIREARAAWKVTEAIAKTETPAPNPVISFGPLFFGNGNILDMATTGYTAAMGWAVPTKNPPRLADKVNRVRADAALARAIAAERMAYLDLRAKLAATLLDDQELIVLAGVEKNAEAARDLVKDFAASGQGDPLDVKLFEYEGAQTRALVIAARGRARIAKYEVAAMLGRVPSTIRVEGSPLPGLALVVPALEDVEQAAIEGHPDLAVLRAEYALAERLLRQEAARANPGLDIGLNFERTQPANQLGLPLGIELPIFDQNQVALAGAKAERDAVRTRYHARLQRMLGEVATAHARLRGRLELLEAIDGKVQQSSDAAVDVASRGMQAGTVDTLRFLTALRTAIFVSIERFAARRETFAAWGELEKAAGVPILQWPDDTQSAAVDDDAEVK